MTPFDFVTAGRIRVGRGAIDQAAPLAAELGRRALVITGRSGRHLDRLAPRLREQGLEVATCAVGREPDLADVRRGVGIARDGRSEVVIGLGGGSVVDAAKAVAALIGNPGDVLDYLEVVGGGRPLPSCGLPCLAIPTTAGTGSEVTRNAVLASREHRVKASLRSPFLLPRAAIVDPDLSSDLPAALTASTGLDALTQLIEAYVSRRANAMTDVLSRDGIRRAARALPRAFSSPGDLEARDEMALASLFSGLALANAGLGAVHGLAGPLGGRLDAPHGAICAALLPHVTRVNVRALQTRASAEIASNAIARFTDVARWLTGRPDAGADDGVARLAQVARDLDIPPLGRWGLTNREVPAVVEDALRASSMKSNPVDLTREELSGILAEAM